MAISHLKMIQIIKHLLWPSSQEFFTQENNRYLCRVPKGFFLHVMTSICNISHIKSLKLNSQFSGRCLEILTLQLKACLHKVLCKCLFRLTLAFAFCYDELYFCHLLSESEVAKACLPFFYASVWTEKLHVKIGTVLLLWIDFDTTGLIHQS